VLLVGGLLAGVLAGCGGGSGLNAQQQAAEAYLDAFGSGEAAKAAAATSDAAAAKTALSGSLAGLGEGARGSFTIGSFDSKSKTVAYTATWKLPGAASTWTYRGSLPVAQRSRKWQVTWAASDMHPKLRTGEHLAAVRVQPPRAALEDSSGAPLFTEQPVVTVGINPQWVKDLSALAHTLASVLHISAADIISAVKAAPRTQFVPVITLRQAAYDAVRDRIHDLEGTQFETGTQDLGPTPTFAQPLLGRVGPATKELVDAAKGAIAAGDQTGLSGLQLAFNEQLSGTAGESVYATTADGRQRLLSAVDEPRPGTPVRLTLDRRVQQAAERALAAVSLPATIVATQPSTGKVLAVASTPAAAAQGDIAFTGQYPPGSTFKIVTYTAAFTTDPELTPATPAACPATIVVNGQTVRNENDFDLGTVPLSSAFAFSCNTTAARLGLQLPAGALRSAAGSLGLGARWSLPVDAFSGSLPEPAGPSATNLRAADAYGQGQVLVSPLLMAVIAGASATGRTVAPSLQEGKQASPGPARPARITSDLNQLMRDVVTVPGATGRDLAGLPGGVEGKTGTAEFGTAKPAHTHSWFAGVRGDMAFSVFIYDGGSSTTGAVPVARAFLSAD
jgi:cell division protein FtsI/penicillin-binding protein 2